MAERAERVAPGNLLALGERVGRRRPSLMQRLLRNRGATAGLLILLIILISGVGAPVIASHDPNDQELGLRLIHPFQNASYFLGTDALGRDMISRLIYGSRVALLVGFTTVALSGSVGIILGLIAGFYGGKLDDLISWVGNVFLSFPFILLAVAVAAVLGGGLRNLIIVLALASWMSYMRIVRGEALAVRSRAYVDAARTVGMRDFRLLFRHILPNVITPVIVIATFEVARMIISEAALSFLGLGVEPSTPSWGGMLADGRTYLASAWWVATFPGIAIMATVLGINLLGDWLRDEFDPRLRS